MSGLSLRWCFLGLTLLAIAATSGLGPAVVVAQAGGSADAKRVYDEIKAFTLSGRQSRWPTCSRAIAWR